MSEQQEQKSYYEGVINTVLQMFWGKSFLSQGGEKDVSDIVEGLDLNGKTVVDIGCGVGGPALTLARKHGAKLICVDVERSQIEETRKLFEEEGYEGSLLATHLKAPEGPISLDSNSVDIVFGKDAWVHIKNKTNFFRECLRVLRPGGIIVASDWMKGENTTKLFDDFEKAWSPLVMNYETLRAYGERLKVAGFEKVQTRDISHTYIDEAQRQLERIRGSEMKTLLTQYVGEEGYKKFEIGSYYIAKVFKTGEVGIGLIKGTKAASKL